MTVRTLQALNHDTHGLRSKSLDGFATGLRTFDFVFTLDQTTPVAEIPAVPGDPMRAHWPITDPLRFVGDEEKTYQVFKAAYFEIERRVKIFASLRIDALERLRLQRDLDEIGTLATA